MTTQQLPPSVRFAHAPNTLNSKRCPYTGLTICYVREDEQVLFTYALCSKDDEYSKKVGRDTTINTWEKLANEQDFVIDFDAIAFIDFTARAGVLGVQVFKDMMDATGAFSDQLIDDVTMYDFKHVYISKLLIDFVIQEIVLVKFPNSRV